ncbi:hypothetical protein M5238_001706 [Vibrio vulnificus]|nr:hypothetical protein [Vibrio vulnificus]ELP5900516.1 hypothetical protein [Vibrio vulnificus]MCU8208032.1 hypothetical protein [Vibrio vulnificus]
MRSDLGKLNGIDLYTRVKAGFLLQGTSLNRWCVENGIHRQNAAQALKGLWNGEKSNLLKERIIVASGISGEE